MIAINRIDDTTFNVNVTAKTNTHHRVTLTNAYYEQLSGGHVDPETLVEKAFEFLLEREPNTAILEEFDLILIKQYFPEFETEVPRLLEEPSSGTHYGSD